MKPVPHQLFSCAEAKQKYASLDLYIFKYRNEDEFDETEKILVIPNSLDLELLSIDISDFTFNDLFEKPDEFYILTVIIEGNLNVQESITNYDTDGSTGLVVLGNLTAKNIIVGGQQLFVQGNLMVQEIVCGSYNHGNMLVKGDASAKYFIPDDYKMLFYGEVTGIVVAEEIYQRKNSGEKEENSPILPTCTLDEVLVDELIDEEFNSLLFVNLVESVLFNDTIYCSNEPLIVFENIPPIDEFTWEYTYLTPENLKDAIWKFPPQIFILDSDNEENVEFNQYNVADDFYYNISRAPLNENLQPLHSNATLLLSDKKKQERYFISIDFADLENAFFLFHEVDSKFELIEPNDFSRLKALQDAFIDFMKLIYAETEFQKIFDYDTIENLRQQILWNVKSENGFNNGNFYIGASNEEDGNNLLWVAPSDLETIYFELKDNFVSIYREDDDGVLRYLLSAFDEKRLKKAKKYIDRAAKSVEIFTVERQEKLDRISEVLKVWSPCFESENQHQFFEKTLNQSVIDPKLFLSENKERKKKFNEKYDDNLHFSEDVMLGLALAKSFEVTNFGVHISHKKSLKESLEKLKPFLEKSLKIEFNENYISAMEEENLSQKESFKKWREENLYMLPDELLKTFQENRKPDKLNNNHIIGLNKKLSEENNPLMILFFEFQGLKSPKYFFIAPTKDVEKITNITSGIYSFSIKGSDF